MTTPPPTHQDLDRLAQAIADHGVEAVEPAVVESLAGSAIALGASPILASVFADAAEPAVARMRAFGRIAAVFANPARNRFVLAA
jgi:hypothetical protein